MGAATSVSILLVSCMAGILNSPYETPEYLAGYNAGYTDHNKSKYDAACVLSDPLFTLCTEEQLHYATGYKSGYKDYQYEELKKQDTDKINNSIQILGI